METNHIRYPFDKPETELTKENILSFQLHCHGCDSPKLYPDIGVLTCANCLKYNLYPNWPQDILIEIWDQDEEFVWTNGLDIEEALNLESEAWAKIRVELE